MIGGAFTTYWSWRYVFVGEVLIVIVILLLARRMNDTPPEKGVKLDPRRHSTVRCRSRPDRLGGLLQLSRSHLGPARPLVPAIFRRADAQSVRFGLRASHRVTSV